MAFVGTVAAVGCGAADAPETVSNCLPSTPAHSHSPERASDAATTTISRTRGERVMSTLSARILNVASSPSEICRCLLVGREERLDRQLGDGDVDGGAEDRHGAEEAQHAVARAQVQRDDDVAGVRGRLGRRARVGADLVEELGENLVAAQHGLAAEALEEVGPPPPA